MAKAPAKQAPPPQRRWLSILISCIAAVVFFGIGIAAGLLYARMTAPSDYHPLSIVIYRMPHDPKNKHDTATEQPLYQTSYYEFDEALTTNLLSSSRITQVKIALSTTYEGRVLDAVVMHRLAIRSAILAVLSSATESDIRSEQGKRKLQDAIRDTANGVLASKGQFPGIEAAHITGLVIQ